MELVHGVALLGGSSNSSYLEDYWSCDGGFSVVNAFYMQSSCLLNSELTRCQMTGILFETVNENEKWAWGRVWRMRGVTRDRTGDSNSRDQTSPAGANGDRESDFPPPADTSRIGNHMGLGPSLLDVMCMDPHTRIPTDDNVLK